MRRLALSMAILAQVNISYQQYLVALSDLDVSSQINDVQQQIQVASMNLSQAKAQSAADKVRRDLAAMVAEFAHDRSIALAHTALANLYSAVGVDLVSPSVDTEDLSTLSAHVDAAISGWEAGQLPAVELPNAAALQPAATATPALAAVARSAQ